MVFGFLYGDVTTGLIAGASLEVIYIGMVNAGGNLPAILFIARLICCMVFSLAFIALTTHRCFIRQKYNFFRLRSGTYW